MISKNIWQTSSIPYEELPIKLKNAFYSWIDINPNYKYHYIDLHECEKFILENYGKKYYNTFMSLHNEKMKSNFWKYLVLYKEGGVYSDIDTICLEPVDLWIKTYDFIVSSNYDNLYCGTTIASSKDNIILKNIIDNMMKALENIDYTEDNIIEKTVGDVMFTNSIKQSLNNSVNFHCYDMNFFKNHKAVQKIRNFSTVFKEKEEKKQYTLWIDCGILTRASISGIPRTIINIIKELLLIQKKINVEIELIDISPDKFEITSLSHLKDNILYSRKIEKIKDQTKIVPKFKMGDVIFLTSFYGETKEKNDYFSKMMSSGLCIIALLFDIFPITHPNFFTNDFIHFFTNWLNSVEEITNGIICISNHTLKEFLSIKNYSKCLSYVHLGYTEIESYKKIHLPKGKNILMVSTIEPRKKYDETLLQFERIWEKRDDINLIIVGKVGWNVEELELKIKNHPRRMTNLHFLNNVSDAELNYLYKNCDVFLFSSEIEGFGLGIVEAARFGTPLLLRDNSVFCEIASDYATYFNAFEELYDIILQNIDNGFKRSDNLPIFSWSETSIKYLQVINYMRNLYVEKYNISLQL